MLEIVHSIAPGAELMFATSHDPNNGDELKHLATNIRAFGNSRNRCHIIVDDREIYDESPFQDDDVSKAVDEVTGKGIFYVTSAGNRGNTEAGTSMAWEGFFKAGEALTDGSAMHVFDEKQNDEYNEVLCHEKGGTVDAHLFWNDPLPSWKNCQSSDLSDYKLWAMNANGVLKELHEDVKDTAAHTPCDKPYRHIRFPAPDSNSSNRTWIVITKGAGKADRFLHLDISVNGSSGPHGCTLLYKTPGVISGHHGAESAFSVAAKSARGHDSALDPDTGAFIGGPTERVNKSSAEGPRQMFFTPHGSPYNPPLVLQKPDVTAADGVTTDVPNFAPFFGTSAAAPQVAGIAALMWSKYPSLTVKEIKNALRDFGNPDRGFRRVE